MPGMENFGDDIWRACREWKLLWRAIVIAFIIKTCIKRAGEVIKTRNRMRSKQRVPEYVSINLTDRRLLWPLNETVFVWPTCQSSFCILNYHSKCKSGIEYLLDYIFRHHRPRRRNEEVARRCLNYDVIRISVFSCSCGFERKTQRYQNKNIPREIRWAQIHWAEVSLEKF